MEDVAVIERLVREVYCGLQRDAKVAICVLWVDHGLAMLHAVTEASGSTSLSLQVSTRDATTAQCYATVGSGSAALRLSLIPLMFRSTVLSSSSPRHVRQALDRRCRHRPAGRPLKRARWLDSRARVHRHRPRRADRGRNSAYPTCRKKVGAERTRSNERPERTCR